MANTNETAYEWIHKLTHGNAHTCIDSERACVCMIFLFVCSFVLQSIPFCLCFFIFLFCIFFSSSFYFRLANAICCFFRFVVADACVHTKWCECLRVDRLRLRKRFYSLSTPSRSVSLSFDAYCIRSECVYMSHHVWMNGFKLECLKWYHDSPIIIDEARKSKNPFWQIEQQTMLKTMQRWNIIWKWKIFAIRIPLLWFSIWVWFLLYAVVPWYWQWGMVLNWMV